MTPGGSHTRSKEPLDDPDLPAFLVRGSGAVVEDVDGRRFIDWNNGLGVLTLGHAHPHVVEAVARQVREASVLALPHPMEVVLAERWAGLVPCARENGQVRWVKTGSEACAAAVRMVRRATSRDVVLVAEGGYHGWHDWVSAVYADSRGIPDAVGALVRTFGFDDIAAFDRVLADAGPDRVAAVVLEPMRDRWPHASFLRHLRDTTRAAGACLVFDEVILGLRLAVAGGQEYFGITPDLAVYGKALGAGLPLACVVGNPTIMAEARVVSSTFGGELLSLAASTALLDIYEREGVIERLWNAGRTMANAMVSACQDLPIVITGSPVRLVLRERDSALGGRLLAAIRKACAKGGVLLDPSAIYPSAAIDDALARRSADVVVAGCNLVWQDWKRGLFA